MPKVSVIIPTYNRAYIISQAIGSILKQTFRDFEILVIDDGSTDDTEKIVRSVIDPKIRYFSKQNGGPSSARNMGMAHSKGLYMAFLDSDDAWPENFLEVMAGRLDEHLDYGAAYASAVIEYPDKTKKRSPPVERCISGKITTQLFKHSIVWPSAVMIRTCLRDKFWFDENLKICEDNDAFLRLSAYAKFLFVPDVIVSRKSSQDSYVKDYYVTGSYFRALSLERFYFRLGGDKLVHSRVAAEKLSSVYYRAGRRHSKKGYRKAAVTLFNRALKYNFFDARPYIGLVRALFLPVERDPCPDWQMPGKLDMPGYAITWKKEK